MSIESRITELAQAIAADVKALLTSLANLSGRVVLVAHLGAGPARVPTIQHLGQMAFVDVVGSTSILRHSPDSAPGDVWREYVSDTTSVLKVHGFDGVVFTIPDFSAALSEKLASIASGATANSTDAQLRARSSHTGTQTIATVAGLTTALGSKVDAQDGKGLSSNDFTNDERVKLANIASQATKNATDALLRDRGTHTGTQAIGTVTDLALALAARLTFAQIGIRPDQVPTNQLLGELAFMNELGVFATAKALPEKPRSIWFSYESDSEVKLCMRGDDGSVRSRVLNLE